LISISSLLISLAITAPGDAIPAVTSVSVDPPKLVLVGPNAMHSLLVSGTTPDGRIVDLTRLVTITSANDRIATPRGHFVRSSSDGETSVQIMFAGHPPISVPVTVRESQRPVVYHFENDVIPLLGRFGCNSSGCHGKAEGQNGFKLSVFGSDPDADYSSLLKEGRGRRVFPASPERSLLLMKGSGQSPHGGGNRIPIRSDAYARLRGWIAAGAPFGSSDAPEVRSIRIDPTERVMAFRGEQQLRVMAKYTDGREIDVTAESRFQTNSETIGTVGGDGLITFSDVPGEVAIMASFRNEVAIFRGMVPRPDAIEFPQRPVYNFIDPLVDAKLRKLRIAPSELCDDSEYLRRVYLDVIGTLPTPTESRQFLNDTDPKKRAKLVDALLQRPEYADYWATKWADVLRVERGVLGHRRAYAYYRWIHDSFRTNKPFDQFVKELLTAEGPLEEVGATNFYRVVPKPGEAASTISQVFLGVRIACAECHHHPFDRWTQTDYYGMQAFFTQVGVRKIGTVDAVMTSGDPVTNHPRTGAKIAPTALTANPTTVTGDRRPVLAEWLTDAKNPWFAHNLANRYWAHFLGRGLVEPIDDVRATNPATNPELLDALAKNVVESKFDIKQLIRTITGSRTYQLASKPNPTNMRDEQNYSRALLKRIDAEVLLDMISQSTGVPEKFQGVPLGS